MKAICLGPQKIYEIYSLPNAVVDVESHDLFKSRFDNFWMLHDVKYDYTIDLTCTGNQSEFEKL